MTVLKKRILASILFVLISFACAAFQLPEEPPVPGPPPPVGFPIDGGVLTGVFFALVYGARKIIINKK